MRYVSTGEVGESKILFRLYLPKNKTKAMKPRTHCNKATIQNYRTDCQPEIFNLSKRIKHCNIVKWPGTHLDLT